MDKSLLCDVKDMPIQIEWISLLLTILRFLFILEGKECGRCLAAWQRGFENEQEDEVFFDK